MAETKTASDGFSAEERAAMKERAAELRAEGMPAYAGADGKVVIFFQDAGTFTARYATLGFQDTAHLDDGDIWPTSYALATWNDAVEERVAALVRAAVG
ncbi:MAG: hypothetical protein AB7O78_08040 [Thermoleophilia bacterium]